MIFRHPPLDLSCWAFRASHFLLSFLPVALHDLVRFPRLTLAVSDGILGERFQRRQLGLQTTKVYVERQRSAAVFGG